MTRASAADGRVSSVRQSWAWWVLDAVLVVLFAATGRASHEESGAMSAVLGTAWPFLLAMTLGWAGVAVARRRPAVALTDGVVVWLTTVVLGMALRAVAGGGVAWSFVLVALGVLGIFLLGWRLIAHRRGLT